MGAPRGRGICRNSAEDGGNTQAVDGGAAAGSGGWPDVGPGSAQIRRSRPKQLHGNKAPAQHRQATRTLCLYEGHMCWAKWRPVVASGERANSSQFKVSMSARPRDLKDVSDIRYSGPQRPGSSTAMSSLSRLAGGTGAQQHPCQETPAWYRLSAWSFSSNQFLRGPKTETRTGLAQAHAKNMGMLLFRPPLRRRRFHAAPVGPSHRGGFCPHFVEHPRSKSERSGSTPVAKTSAPRLHVVREVRDAEARREGAGHTARHGVRRGHAWVLDGRHLGV